MIAVYRVTVNHMPSTGEMMIRICSIYGKMRNIKNVSADHTEKSRYVARKST